MRAVRPSDGHLTQLTDGDVGLWPSDCTAGGERLAVTTIGQWHAVLMERDGHGKWLTTDLGPGEGAAFAPDGRRVAFLRREGSLRHVTIREPDGSLQQITTDLGQRSRPSWSPDGTRVIVSRTEASRDIWLLPRVVPAAPVQAGAAKRALEGSP